MNCKTNKPFKNFQASLIIFKALIKIRTKKILRLRNFLLVKKIKKDNIPVMSFNKKYKI